MKKAIIICVILWLGAFALKFDYEEGHIRINNQRAGVFFLKGGYHAYWINYSHGVQYLPNGKTKNYWHWPTFSRCDLRDLIKQQEKRG